MKEDAVTVPERKHISDMDILIDTRKGGVLSYSPGQTT